ncbi:Hemicentin-2, partial [Pygoscelis adeliae]
DAGIYLCVARNPSGTAAGRTRLIVQVPPVIAAGPAELAVLEGLEGLLPRAARGGPRPRVSWSREGAPVWGGGGKATVLPSGEHLLRDIQSTDAGHYRCVVENDAGTAAKVVTLALQREPHRVRGSLVGIINAYELGVTTLDASVLDDPHSGTTAVRSSISSIPPAVGPLMRVLVAVIAPVYWSLAHAGGDAQSGFLLTRGTFRHESQLEFATGEGCQGPQACRGPGGVPGLIPLPASPQDFSERYVHTGVGRLSGGSVQSFLQDGRIIHAHCDHTIVYDPSTGLQPPRVQHVRASAVEASFDPALEELRFQLRASLDAGANRDQCPPGFILGPQQLYCLDINECLQSPPPCAFECRNLRGSYECLCPPGMTL